MPDQGACYPAMTKCRCDAPAPKPETDGVAVSIKCASCGRSVTSVDERDAVAMWEGAMIPNGYVAGKSK